MHIEKKKNNRLVSAALVLTMAAALLFSQTSAFARGAVDTKRECTLTVEVGSDWEDLKTVEIPVQLYRVASIDAEGNYTAEDDFVELQEMLDAIDETTVAADWAAMAESASGKILAQIVTDENGEKILPEADAALTMKNGKGSVGEIPCGLYLVWADTVSTEAYDYTFTPYLVSAPSSDYAEELASGNTPGAEVSDDWNYDIEVSLKPEQSERTGELRITKTLETYNASLGTPLFVFEITARMNDEVVYNDVVSLAFDGGTSKEVVVEGIPAGSVVTVTEVYSGAGYRMESAPSVEVEIVAGEQADASFTNDYNDQLIYGTGVVNHFAYDGMGFSWEQLEDNE